MVSTDDVLRQTCPDRGPCSKRAHPELFAAHEDPLGSSGGAVGNWLGAIGAGGENKKSGRVDVRLGLSMVAVMI
jgi:hypothetical protein